MLRRRVGRAGQLRSAVRAELAFVRVVAQATLTHGAALERGAVPFDGSFEDRVIGEKVDEVKHVIRTMLDEGLAERRSIFF